VQAWFKHGLACVCRPLVIAASNPVGVDLAIVTIACQQAAHCPDCSSESVIDRVVSLSVDAAAVNDDSQD